VFEEPACRGLQGPRAELEQALARVECGESEAIVVTRLHRIGYSLAHALATIERIQAAGGTFVSVLDRIDLSTTDGRQALRILLSVVAFCAR
jgi:DNA invertase Pin-like site-specific DNA recombinase